MKYANGRNFGFRVDDQLAAKIMATAKAEGITPSAVARRAVIRDLATRMTPQRPQDSQEAA